MIKKAELRRRLQESNVLLVEMLIEKIRIEQNILKAIKNK